MDISEPSVAYNIAGCLRAASIGIALYDFLETMPATLRFYREHSSIPHLTISPILFFLIQTISIVALTVSNVGFFSSQFTIRSCQAFYLVPSVFKVLQGMISHAIIGVRAFNLSRRSRKTGAVVAVVFLVAVSLEWLTTMYGRRAVWDETYKNCRSAFEVQFLGAWTYYAVAIVYDTVITAISVFHIVRSQAMCGNNFTVTKLTQTMLYDGLGYFVVLTGINCVNLVIYRATQEVRTAGASLGYCLTWIMSQRLLLHLHAVSRDRRNESIHAAVTFTQNLDSARDVSRAIRSQFEPKAGLDFDLSVPDYMSSIPESEEISHVQVRIEKTIRAGRRGGGSTMDLENYNRSKTGQS